MRMIKFFLIGLLGVATACATGCNVPATDYNAVLNDQGAVVTEHDPRDVQACNASPKLPWCRAECKHNPYQTWCVAGFQPVTKGIKP